MTVRLTRLLTFQEYKKITDFCQLKDNNYYALDSRLFLPGIAWYTPWVYCPEWETVNRHTIVKQKDKGNTNYLSIHYWNDWADRRLPLCIVTPDGNHHEIDRRSSNGDGWKVEGEFPSLTASPSLITKGWHGFLQRGEFTNDYDGRDSEQLYRDRIAELNRTRPVDNPSLTIDDILSMNFS